MQTHLGGPLFPLSEAPGRLTRAGYCWRNGRAVSERSIRYWCQRGVGGSRLDFVAIDGVRYTSLPALRRFLDALGQAGSDRHRGLRVRPGATLRPVVSSRA